MVRSFLFLVSIALAAYCQESTSSLPQKQSDRLPYAPSSLQFKDPPPLQATDAGVVLHGRRDKKLVALTFDACATRRPSRYDERITSILLETNTPATLFLGGKWMEEESEQTKYLASIPLFELANHSFLHPHLTGMSDDRIRQELAWTQKVMYSLTGRQPTLFRAPYGEYDDRVVRIAASMGLTTIQFDLASGDPDSTISKERLIDYVSSMAKSGSIIVMHINRGGMAHSRGASNNYLPIAKTGIRVRDRRRFVVATASNPDH